MATKSTLFLALALLAIIATNQLLVSAMPDDGAVMAGRKLTMVKYDIEYECEYKGKNYGKSYMEKGGKWTYYYEPVSKQYCCYDKEYYAKYKKYVAKWSYDKC